MPRAVPPAFQFYPRDYLADLRVQVMSYAAQGAYWRLCCLYWVERSLPDDPAYLARALNLSRRTFEKLWTEIAPCFTRGDKGLRHKRLDAERAKQARWAAKCSAGGKLGMARRWGQTPESPDKGSYPVVITSDNSALALAVQVQKPKIKTAASPPAQPVENLLTPVENVGPPNLRVLLKLAHTFHGEHFESEAAFEEALMRAAIQHHLAYDKPSIRRVVQLVQHGRRPVMSRTRRGGTG